MNDFLAWADHPPVVKSDFIETTQTVRFTNWVRADRCKRQIIATIEAFETIEALEVYMAAESLLHDAITLYDQQMGDDITEAFEGHKAILRAGGA